VIVHHNTSTMASVTPKAKAENMVALVLLNGEVLP
jgi:hypothetical protein